MARSKSNQGSSGRQTKVFVEKHDVALDLARSIGDAQEDKSKQKAEKYHHNHPTKDKAESSSQASRKHRAILTGKQKLKQVKAIIVADRARSKKERIKLRKESRKSESESSQATETHTQIKERALAGGQSVGIDPRPRKRVAFA